MAFVTALEDNVLFITLGAEPTILLLLSFAAPGETDLLRLAFAEGALLTVVLLGAGELIFWRFPALLLTLILLLDEEPLELVVVLDL